MFIHKQRNERFHKQRSMISETEKQDFIDREARLSTNLVRLILHEFCLPYPRLRTRTPETAHSHGHIDKSRLHTSKTHTLHTSKTPAHHTSKTLVHHTSKSTSAPYITSQYIHDRLPPRHNILQNTTRHKPLHGTDTTKKPRPLTRGNAAIRYL